MTADQQFWDDRYAAEGYLFGEEPSQFVTRRFVDIAPGGRVLAVADGEGRNGVFLAGKGFDVLSVDASPVAVAKALDLASRRGVILQAQVVDLEDWVWPEAAFDAVVAVFIQFAPPDLRARLFAGMKAAVRPGGRILLHGYRPEQLAYGTGGPRAAANLYTADGLAAAFSDWRILTLDSYDAELREGAGHAGMSALIDLVAERPA